MPVLNMEVPINTEAYYRGETIARRGKACPYMTSSRNG